MIKVEILGGGFEPLYLKVTNTENSQSWSFILEHVGNPWSKQPAGLLLKMQVPPLIKVLQKCLIENEKPDEDK